MKKLMLLLLGSCLLVSGCNKKQPNQSTKSLYKVGIAKIVQHEALDDAEKGIMDYLKDNNVECSFDLQNANGDLNTASQIASLYKAKKVNVAVGIGTPVAVAFASSMKDIPVVFATVTDPVGAGLVSTKAHGEGNVCGMSDELPTSQQIKTFKELTGIKTLGYIYTSSEDNSLSSLQQVSDACKELGLELVSASITKSAELKQAAESIVNRVDGIYLSTDNTVFSALPSLVTVFSRAKKPVFSGDVTGARKGGCFMAQGFNYYKAGYATGKIVKDMLEGKKASDIPVLYLTRPEDSDLLFDLDACKNCGINIPESLIAKATYLIKDGQLIKQN